MKKDEFRKLNIGNSIYGTTYIKGKITLMEFVITGKTEDEILVRIKNTSNSLVGLSKNDLSAITPFKYKLLFTSKNDAINKALEGLENNKQELIALLD